MLLIIECNLGYCVFLYNVVLVTMVTTVMNHMMDVYQTPVIEYLVSA